MSDNQMPAEFQALLAKPADEFEPPKPQPVGDFVLQVTGFKFDKSRDKKTPYVGFNVGFVEPLPSVAEDALADWLAGEPLNSKKLSRTFDFYLTPDAMFRIGEFMCDHCGVEKGIPTSEQIQATVGQQFVGHFEEVPGTGKNEGKTYVNLVSTAPVPA